LLFMVHVLFTLNFRLIGQPKKSIYQPDKFREMILITDTCTNFNPLSCIWSSDSMGKKG
jgi:hypothetical protein